MSAENVAVVRSVYENFAKGDVGAVLAVLSPDIEWVESTHDYLPFAGTHRGPSQVVEHVFGPVFRDWDEFAVVPERFHDKARAALAELPARDRGRVEMLEGDPASMDLGLSGAEVRKLASEVAVIHHCAAITYLGVERRVAEQVNVGGTREVLELAALAPSLERLVHWSTSLVSGARRGYVLEEELTAPAGFRNVIEETRFRAERLVRAGDAGFGERHGEAARLQRLDERPAVPGRDHPVLT